MVHVEGVPPLDWQTMPCNSVGRKEDDGYLACRGLDFLYPDMSARLLVSPWNIAEAYQLIFALLTSQAPPYEEALDWLQFSYTGDRSGAYVVPGSTKVTFQTSAEGGPLFALAFQHLCTLYPGPTPRVLRLR